MRTLAIILASSLAVAAQQAPPRDARTAPSTNAAPSGTGVQASLFGVLGVLGGVEEGLELNLLGATVGVDPNDWGLKLPLVGRLGFGG